MQRVESSSVPVKDPLELGN